MQSSTYAASTITVLEGLEAIRRRPAMYIGDTRDGSGLHQLAWDLVDSALDEHMAGHATRLRVTLRPGSVTVEDDGRGLPTGRSIDGSSQLVSMLTIFGRYCAGRHGYVGPDLRGMRVPVVTALSERLDVTTHAERRIRAAFERGRLVDGPRDLGPTAHTGTTITCRPDPSIFRSVQLSAELVRERLTELAATCPALQIDFDAGAGLEPLTSRRGHVELVRRAAPGTTPQRLRGAAHDVLVDVVLAWRASGRPRVRGFANCARADAGTHVDGLWSVLEDAMLQTHPGVSPEVRRELVGEGLEAVVDVRLHDVSWGSPMRKLLGSAHARDAVVQVLSRCGLVGRLVASRARATGQNG